MKYHKQLSLWNKEDKIKTGSCYPTVIACLLDLELHEVPYVNLLYFKDNQITIDNLKLYRKLRYLKGKEYNEGEDYQKDNHDQDFVLQLNLWHIVMEMWLASRGYFEDWITDVDRFLKDNPGVPYMATGTSARGVGHVVIYKDGQPYHDPHPSGSFLDKNFKIEFKGLFPINDYLNRGKYYEAIKS